VKNLEKDINLIKLEFVLNAITERKNLSGCNFCSIDKKFYDVAYNYLKEIYDSLMIDRYKNKK